MSSPDDFFSQNTGQTGSLKSRRKAPPPPPPRPSTSGTNASSSTYYGSSTSQRTTTSRAAPPPRRSTAAQRQQPSSYQASSQAPAPTAPTFYSTTGGGYPSTSNASSTTGSSYYGTPVPAATTFLSSSTTSMNQSTTSTTTAPTNQSSNDEWYTSSTPAPANDWYSAPQQQAQPTYTDFSHSQSKSSSLAGIMDGSISATTTTTTPMTTFTPSQPATMQSSSNIDDFDNEPPLLEELGINLQHISIKTKAVVLPLQRFNAKASQVMHEDDNDLAGPLVFALLLGGELLLMGKLQFSYIYGFGVFGCLSMTLVLNLMSPVAVSVWSVASVLGYALLPVNLLALVKIAFFGKLELLCAILAVLTIAWCTVASTRLLEQKCGMRHQRYLVAYPIALLYSAFVMITIF